MVKTTLTLEKAASKWHLQEPETLIMFRDENGNYIHPMEASNGIITIQYETIEIIEKMIQHYEAIKDLASKQIVNEVRTDCPF